MASTLVRGKYVICKIAGPTSAEVISDGAVFQRDGEIIEVGSYNDLRVRHPTEEVIGSSKYVVMPGLINDHFHIGLTPFQRGAPDLPLELWGLALMGTRELDPYLDHLYGAIQMIESGTTTVQVLQVSGRDRAPITLEVADKVLKAYQDAGMRVSYGPLLVNQNSSIAGARGGEKEFAAELPSDLAERYKTYMGGYLPIEDVISNIEEICKKYGGNSYERIRVNVAPSNVHRCSDDLLVALKRLAATYSANMHIHLQETVYQKLYGLRTWGKTPLQHLYDLGFLGPDVTCGHSVWLTDEDLEVMTATATNVCHNPSSNLRLKSGIAPVNRLLEMGIGVAIGTDEAGLNDDKDMLQEMRLALKLHRVPGLENTPPTAHQVFQMATVNGAYATGYGDRVGTLEPGKRADMVLINLQNIEEPYLDPDVSIVDAVVHRGRSIDVDTVMIDGEVVMRDRHLTGVDKESLFSELKKSLNRPLLPRELERRDLGRQLEPYLRRFYAGTLGEPSIPHYNYNARS